MSREPLQVIRGGLDDRVPPHDDHLERCIVAAMLHNPSVRSEACALLADEHFFIGPNRIMFRALADMHAKSEVIDISTLGSFLREQGHLAILGGLDGLVERISETESIGNMSRYALGVRDAWRMRRAAEVAQRLLGKVYGAYEDAQVVLEATLEELQQLAAITTPKATGASNETAADTTRLILSCAKAQGSITGLTSGFRDYDTMTGGMHPQELTIIGARPAMGKTSFLVSMALAAADSGNGVALFSLEMPSRDLMLRAACSRTSVPLHHVRGGTLSQSNVTQLFGELQLLGQLPIYWVALSSPTVLEIRTQCERIGDLLEAKGKKLSLVAVDYLQKMRPATMRKSGTREQEVSEIAQSLKCMAQKLDVPLVVAAQLNRDAVKGGTLRRPQMSDLRESGAIEQEADNIVFLHREDYMLEQTNARGKAMTGEAEVIISKQRNGPTGTVTLRFVREFTRFEDAL